MLTYNKGGTPTQKEGDKDMNAEAKAKAMIATQSTEKLVEQFELTETINDKDIFTVRGWLMDELEARDAQAFEKWIDSNDESPRKYYL